MSLSFDKVNKVITVDAPDTEITIQNLLNSIREYEDELTSLDIPKICSCAGKESLGGGVSVGLTLTLLDDWQLAFEARSGPDYIQCKVSGGNIVATNVNGAIEPTAFTQVLITASSSATQSDIAAIQYSSFGGGVSINIANGAAGTEYNIGTIENPCNNFADGLLIAIERGFSTFFITGDVILSSGIDFKEMNFVGESKTKTVITIDASADVEKCEFYDAEITGILDGGNVLKNCLIGNINYINGFIEQCVLKTGTITLGGSEEAHFLDCWSGVVGTATPIIDMGGSGQGLGMRNYNGGIELRNKSGPEKVSIDLNSGQIILHSTVTNGEIMLRGLGHLTDNSAGATVNSADLICYDTIGDAVWEHTDAEFLTKILKNKKSLIKNGSIWELIVYDDDNITPILNKALKDKDGNDITDLAAGELAQELQSSV